ncbi:MAG: deoxynucleoside kinase [Armatimonadota bacterium]|nr:deoxynucleoside kinase [Armatimonadota bacterium]MDR5697333.1 deoxynucleoside kinase [Armatimonadota bacterium]
MKWYVAVSGNMGSGKSTLTAHLSHRLGWQPFYEAVEENPYLADFYAHMQAWSFHSQLFFLLKRFAHCRRIQSLGEPVLQDRTIYEDAEIFARNLYIQGLMEDRDYRFYVEIYQTLVDLLRPPDLVIYLRASVSTLKRRIAARDRSFERRVPRGYLEQLNQRYEEWIARYEASPVLEVDADTLVLDDLDWMVEEIQGRLQTLFPLARGGKPTGDGS